MSLEAADRLLIARLSREEEDATEPSWDFLLGAWTRCLGEEAAARRTFAGDAATGTRAQSALRETRMLLVSYMGLVIQMPDMFPRGAKCGQAVSAQALVPSLLRLGAAAGSLEGDEEMDSAQDWAAARSADAPQLLADLVARFTLDDGLDEVVGGALHALTQRVRRGEVTVSLGAEGGGTPGTPGGAPGAENPMINDVQAVLSQMLGLNDPRQMAGGPGGGAREPEGMTIAELDWRPFMMAVSAACENKALAAAVPKFASFLPADAGAPDVERTSLLGPLLRLSCFPDAYPSIAKQQFSDPRSRSTMELENSMNSLRLALDVVHAQNFRIFNALVRASPESREGVLHFWAQVCALNAKRGAMRVRSREVASDAFMVNVYELVLRFAEPFVEPRCAKMDRIDPRYMQLQRRIDTATLTRINATESEAAQWISSGSTEGYAPNFITEVFFLGTRLTTLALGKAMRRVDEREKEMDRVQKRIDELEADRSTWAGMPHAASFEHVIKRGRAQAERLHSEIFAAQAQLLERGFVQRVVSFAAFTMTWIIRLADPRGTHPNPPAALPLPAEVPETFRMLPEPVFEDACEVLLFYARHRPDVLDEFARTTLVVFCTTFLVSGWYVRNPFLKAKLAELLAYNVMPYGPYPQGVVGDVVNCHPVALEHLMPALMAFWIDAESTGSHTQFYDKFNFRYHLSQVFKAILPNPDHRRQLHRQSQQPDFVVFINRLMNDVTFLLDDALEKLAELHAKQAEMDDTAAWNERPPQERQEREGILRSIQAQIRSDLALGHEFLRLLISFTGETGAAFMMPEIVDRLAAMLDYNLDVLVGPRCQELKVKDPKQVGFDPRKLLSEILSVYLNLAGQPGFAAAIARDGRSYSRDTFSKAASIAQRHMLKSPPEIDVLARLVAEVERVRREEAEEEEDLGDVPDDFLDPLLATLMKDPVRLPSSRAVVDRSTIKAHLLSDGTDPFNRMPLKLEDVQPADDVREQIESWLRERRAQHQSLG